MHTADSSARVTGTAGSMRSHAAAAAGLAPGMALLAVLWWILVQGRMDAWLIGLPAVWLAALAANRRVRRTTGRLSVAGLPGFIALFLRESVRGGLDVALRTLAPRPRIAPGFYRYRLHISHPGARVLLINSIGLLPGTLASGLDGDHAELHLLDTGENPEPQLLRLEQAIAGVFGLEPEMTGD